MSDVTPQEIAGEWYRLFKWIDVEGHEDKGRWVTSAGPDHPLTTALYHCHEGWPDDYIYGAVRSILASLEDLDEIDDDTAHEIADSEVDWNTYKLRSWFRAHAEWVDEARYNFGPSDKGIDGDLVAGQYAQLHSIAITLIAHISEEAERRNDDD